MAWIIEKVIKQYTILSFVHSAFTGDNYFTSAWTSMALNNSNKQITEIVQITEGVVSLGGNLVICAVNVILG